LRWRTFDYRLISGLIIAHILLLFSFSDKSIFWYIFAASSLLLISFAMFQEDVDDEASFFKYIFIGTISGLLLFSIFWLGHAGLLFLHFPIENSVKRLYHWYAPSEFWQYLALVLAAAPGEELFWRGFIQKRLLKHLSPIISILVGSVLYASVQIYSHELTLVFATFISGLAWGFLYYWKKSMPLVIVSHLIFDIMLFIILPLR
jgi:membrane protease YdiL (CAAX protease family)